MQRLPPHLAPARGTTEDRRRVKKLLRLGGLHTVCESARCPNVGECFGRRTATFLILGDKCSRRCSFCAVKKGTPIPPDPKEPANVAVAVKELGIRHVVVTSTTRDDLEDGGAAHFAAVIGAIRESTPEVSVEILVPDFAGRVESWSVVFESRPDVFNHNIETVPRLYPEVRSGAEYDRSLRLLKAAKDAGLATKSGLMLGLGEERDEVARTMKDLADVGCDALTLGQYLQPTRTNRPVSRYLKPHEFDDLRAMALEMGFLHVASGPLVRSSYMAENFAGGNIRERSIIAE